MDIYGYFWRFVFKLATSSDLNMLKMTTWQLVRLCYISIALTLKWFRITWDIFGLCWNDPKKNQLDLVFSPKNWQLSPNTTFFLHTFFILNVSSLLTNDLNLKKNSYYMHIMEPNVPFNLIFLWKFINMLQKKNLQAKAIDQRLRLFERCSFRQA